MGKPLTLIAAGLLALPTAAAAAETWREEPAVAALFQQAGVVGTFVLLDESRGELRGYNQARAEQRFSPASTFKIPNSLIGLSLGAVSGVDERIPYTGGPNPFMREWLEPMGLRGAIRVSNVPLYQELARRIGLRRMDEAVHRLGYGNEQIGSDVTTFWLRGPLAISAVEQTRFLSRLAHQKLHFPRTAQQQVAAITQVDAGPGWNLHAKTGWQNSPGAGVGWWVGWVQQGRRITPFALNIAMTGPADTPKREQLGRASLQTLGVLPRSGVLTGTTHK
jgi:beta-lactamase class D